MGRINRSGVDWSDPASIRAYRRKWYADNPQKFRQAELRTKLKSFGLTEDEYNKVLEAQGGCCTICRKTPSGTRANASLHLDHDHRTGRPRGLLCNLCNQALGMMKDDPEILARAITYLRSGGSIISRGVMADSPDGGGLVTGGVIPQQA